MDHPSVSMQTMEPILKYHTLRKKEFDETYGNGLVHDDSDYPNPKEKNQGGDAPEEVVDLTADDEDDQPRQPPHRNPPETQSCQHTPSSYQEQREKLLNLYRVLNRDHSMRPYYISHVLDNPLRYKDSDQQTISKVYQN